jgi:folate-binding protein YgfZ
MSLNISNSQPNLTELPESFAIELTNLSAISLSGEEKSKYLQGQVTCDVESAEPHSLLNGAHCNAKGKTLSAFRFINRLDAHLLIQDKSSIATSLAELKKFGVFAKVEINESAELSFIALVGSEAETIIKKEFQVLPDNLSPVIQVDTTTIVYIAGRQARFLLIDSQDKTQQLLKTFNLNSFNHNLWNLLEIIEGFPVLNDKAVAEYVPQMLNLQAIHGISFTKGCYLGQETVARMQYLGKNKRALFALSGTADKDVTIESLEVQLGENWRKAGDVLNQYQSDNGDLYIQAVLASDLESSAKLRIKGQETSTLTPLPLPYTLD